MSLESSPSLEDYKDGIPAKLPDQKARRKRLWIIIISLAVVTLVLGVINFLQSDTAAILAGTGTITGTVINENGHPVAAEIYILGTNVKGKADLNGRFTVDNVPSGNQSVAVAFQGSGFEYPAFVQAGETIDLGEVQFTSTLEPHE